MDSIYDVALYLVIYGVVYTLVRAIKALIPAVYDYFLAKKELRDLKKKIDESRQMRIQKWKMLLFTRRNKIT